MAIHSVPFVINPHMNDAERKRIVDMCTQDSYISHLFERDYREPITDETKDTTLVNFLIRHNIAFINIPRNRNQFLPWGDLILCPTYADDKPVLCAIELLY